MTKCVSKNLAKFSGKHLCQSHCFNKFAGWRPVTLLKRRLGTDLLVNFVNFLATFILRAIVSVGPHLLPIKILHGTLGINELSINSSLYWTLDVSRTVSFEITLVRPSVCLSVRLSVRLPVRLSLTFVKFG